MTISAYDYSTVLRFCGPNARAMVHELCAAAVRALAEFAERHPFIRPLIRRVSLAPVVMSDRDRTARHGALRRVSVRVVTDAPSRGPGRSAFCRPFPGVGLAMG